MVHVSPTDRRSERRQQTSDDIVDAALRRLEGDGVEALTMHKLADELGYAVGALYRYFPSKDALLLAVQRRVLEALTSDIVAGVARADDHARQAGLSPSSSALLRVLAAVAAYRSLPGRRPGHFAMMTRWLADPRPLVRTEEAMQHLPALLSLFQPIAAVFDDAVAAGAFTAGPSERRLVALWGALQGVLQLQKMARFGVAAIDPTALAADVTRALCLGWGADAATFDDVADRVFRLDLFATEGV